MRLFSAVVPPQHVRRDVLATLETAQGRPRFRWTHPDKLHLTGVFLADVAPARLAPVIASVDAAAAAVSPFDVELRGLGAFPNPLRARVLFVDVSEGRDELVELHRVQSAALLDAGIEVDERPLSPHLTIARPKRLPTAEEFQALADELAPWRWRFRVEQFELIESRMQPRGAFYSVRHATGLVGS